MYYTARTLFKPRVSSELFPFFLMQSIGPDCRRANSTALDREFLMFHKLFFSKPSTAYVEFLEKGVFQTGFQC